MASAARGPERWRHMLGTTPDASRDVLHQVTIEALLH